MSLSVSYNQKFKTGIDTSVLKEVTQQIFQKANEKTVDLSRLDLTKFNRPTLGKDFYSGKMDASTARQIAMANSGIQVNLSQNALASLHFLNTQASKALFSNVDGKITPAVKEETAEAKKAFESPVFGCLTEAADLGKDKRGSNPFYKGELLGVSKKEENEEIINTIA